MEPRKQKHDRRDAQHLLNLLVRGDFPRLWLPSAEERDVRVLVEHRHQLVQMRTRAKNGLQAMARKLVIRLYIMLREGIDYAEFVRRGSHAGMLGDVALA